MRKKCRVCGIVKTAGDFYSEKRCKDGLRGKCKSCDNAKRKTYPQPTTEQWRLWYKIRAAKDPAYNFRVKTKIKFSGDDFFRLLKEQNGRCGVCKRKMNKVCIDHNRRTKRVRGLLCNNCNLALGLVCDDLNTIESMRVYLILSER